jgi:hypothetical protein
MNYLIIDSRVIQRQEFTLLSANLAKSMNCSLILATLFFLSNAKIECPVPKKITGSL